MIPKVKLWGIIGNFCRKKPLGALGAIVTIFVIFLAIFANQLSPHDPRRAHTYLKYSSPGALDDRRDPPVRLWLGGDRLGRDVLSRVIFGARVSLYVALLATLTGVTAGAVLGLASGFVGGFTDLIVQRVLDGLMAFPDLVIALVILSVWGPATGHGMGGLEGLEKLIIAIGVGFLAPTTRTIRSQTLRLRETDFVLAARAMGARDLRIMFRHITPNCVAPYIVIFTIAMGWAVISEATLSFLGLGIPPSFPSWGGMLTGATQVWASSAPWLGVFPGVAIVTCVLAWNFLGDALRDVLDPRMRGTG